MITVQEFIEYLKTLPQDIPVLYQFCSELTELEFDAISVDKVFKHNSVWMDAKRNGIYIPEGTKVKMVKALVLPGN